MLSLFVALWFWGAPSWPDVVERVKVSVAHIMQQVEGASQRDWQCSATVIGDHWLLSLNHCFRLEATYWADGQPIKVVHTLPSGIVVLESTGRRAEWRPIPVAQRGVRRGEAVAIIGFALGSAGVAPTFGHVSAPSDANLMAYVGQDKVWLDLVAMAGHSGAPVVNAHGELVTLLEGDKQDVPGSSDALAFGPLQADVQAAVRKALGK